MSIYWTHAQRVADLLYERGIQVSNILGLDPDDYRICSPGSCSIYHYTGESGYAEIAFQLGFKDWDARADRSAATPAASDWCQHDPNYGPWLIAKGTDYVEIVDYAKRHMTSEESAMPLYTVVHMMMQAFGYPGNRLHGLGLADRGFRRVFALLSLVETGDGCLCGCSGNPTGCVPWTIFLTGICRSCLLAYLEGSKPPPRATAARFMQHFDARWIGEHIREHSELLLGPLIRVLTFH